MRVHHIRWYFVKTAQLIPSGEVWLNSTICAVFGIFLPFRQTNYTDVNVLLENLCAVHSAE